MAHAEHRVALVGCLLAVCVAGCGDEVVGAFESTGGATTSATTSTDGSSAGSSSSSSSSGGSSSSTGADVFDGPGCFSDDFEDGVIDPALWNTWIEADAGLEEFAGMLKFTPPTTGVFDSGVVGAFEARFRFETGWVRVRVPTPPSPTRSVVLFLQILGENDSLISMQIAGSLVGVSAAVGGVDQYYEEFAADPYPAWIGIRAEGGRVHFEVSNDGASYTELTVHDQAMPFQSAVGLLMAQTYGQDLEGGIVAVDDFEVCLQ